MNRDKHCKRTKEEIAEALDGNFLEQHVCCLELALSANGLHKSHGTLGDYLRRMKARIGKAEAITATAHKIARIVYTLLATLHEMCLGPWVLPLEADRRSA